MRNLISVLCLTPLCAFAQNVSSSRDDKPTSEIETHSQKKIEIESESDAKKAEPIFVKEIKCEGAKKTSCEDLSNLLFVKQNRFYAEDELNALTIKLEQLGYYSKYEVAIEPLEKPNHANLKLTLVEKQTVRHMVIANMALNSTNSTDNENRKTLNIDPEATYSFSDHNFMGNGYYFHGSLTGRLNGYTPEIKGYNLEVAAPLDDSLVGSLRVVNLPTGIGFSDSKTLLLAGLYYQLTENSTVSGYLGNAYGVNYTYHTEDNSFIPTTGSLVSLGYLELLQTQARTSAPSFDARTHWQLGTWSQTQGVLSIGAQMNGMLNPNIRSIEQPQRNSSVPESGINYSLVKTAGDGKRSSVYFGLGGLGFTETQRFFVMNAGFKAQLENMDVALAFSLSNMSTY